MATDSTRNQIFISRKPKKTRSRITATGNNNNNNNINPFMHNTLDTSHNLTIPKTTSPVSRKVPVLYYLTRNGHIEHPHLIHVPLSSLDGLYLRDVMNTLNYYRGKGMANMYSWSFKRSYKNGYVWHDVSEDDLLEVTNGHDYILKGSEIRQVQTPLETNHSSDDCSGTTTAALAVIRRRNQSWSSFDNPQEYMVVKCESSRELAANFAADAATQTEEQRRRRSVDGEQKEDVAEAVGTEEMPSPPPSNSSSEEVTGGRYVDQIVRIGECDRTVEDRCDGGGRMKASQVLKQLITCGAPSSRLKMQAG